MDTITKPSLENRIRTDIPTDLADALARASRTQKYSDLVAVLHCFQLTGAWIGVAGDPHNGSYEAFCYQDGRMKITDVGYGDSEDALREACAMALRLPRN